MTPVNAATRASLGLMTRSALRLSAALTLAALVGCSTSPTTSSGGGGGTTTPPAKAAATVYTPDPTGAYIFGFSATTSGNVNPSSTLTLPSGDTEVNGALATDSTGQIYVEVETSNQTFQVLVYPASSTGSATPTRTINLSNGTGFYNHPLAIDSAGSLYVGSTTENGTIGYQGYITVYSSTATGTATPTRTITGTQTGLVDLYDLAVDSEGDIYAVVFTGGTITNSLLVFAPTANGNVAPTRTITNATNAFVSVAILSSGNAAVLATNSILEFSPTASGAATPVTTIDLGLSNSISPYYVRSDAVGNLYVSTLDQNSNPSTTTISGYSASASGTATPFVSITSAATNGNNGVIALY